MRFAVPEGLVRGSKLVGGLSNLPQGGVWAYELKLDGFRAVPVTITVALQASATVTMAVQ